ncbi:DedA family protein [Bacillaceae bacterium]
MENWITQFLEESGYIGIFIIMALETIFPPIPSEIVLPFCGFMTTMTDLSLVGVLVTATAGSVLGAIIFYGLGLLFDIERLEKIVERWGNVLKITKNDLRRADEWFDRYGIWTVFFCRMMPLLRSLISIPAGISHMDFLLFLLFTTAGTFIWNAILVGFGAGLGEAWPIIVDYISYYSLVIYFIIALLLLLAIVWYMRRRGR